VDTVDRMIGDGFQNMVQVEFKIEIVEFQVF
jgi:hypothetical protein